MESEPRFSTVEQVVAHIAHVRSERAQHVAALAAVIGQSQEQRMELLRAEERKRRSSYANFSRRLRTCFESEPRDVPSIAHAVIRRDQALRRWMLCADHLARIESCQGPDGSGRQHAAEIAFSELERHACVRAVTFALRRLNIYLQTVTMCCGGRLYDIGDFGIWWNPVTETMGSFCLRSTSSQRSLRHPAYYHGSICFGFAEQRILSFLRRHYWADAVNISWRVLADARQYASQELCLFRSTSL